jgi:hypothetical protein
MHRPSLVEIICGIRIKEGKKEARQKEDLSEA